MSPLPKRPPRVLVANINRKRSDLAGCRAIERAITAIAEEAGAAVEVRIAHWPSVDRELLRTWRARALVLGPNGAPFPSYPPAFDRFLALVRARRGPTLGICGGHQALAIAHGSPVGPVFPVAAARETYAGMPKVEGPARIRLWGDPDPLTAGLPAEITLAASHVDEVKEVPRAFRLMGIGDPCNIQIIRADSRPLYGIQGHPEREVARGGGAGRRLLENFLRLAGVIPE